MPASASRFHISSTNPNEQIGGGGCACSPLKCEDQVGPFAVFSANETSNNLSPHLVVCFGCAEDFAIRAPDAETLQSGELDIVPVHVDTTAIEVDDDEELGI